MFQYGWYLRRIGLCMEHAANLRLQQSNLTVSQMHMLMMLSGEPGEMARLKELESRFHAAQSTVAGIAQRLEKKGLIESLAAPEDRRVKLVRLTDAGRALTETCHADIRQNNERLVSALNEEERGQLAVLLQKVYETVK